MKKSLLMSMVFGIAGCLTLQAEPVTSVNMVGYASKNVSVSTTNRYFFMSGAFSKIADTNDYVTVTDLFGTNGIAAGTVVYLWNGVGYASELFGTRWIPGTNRIERSDGFWFKAASAGTVFLSGEVPNSSMVVTTVTAIAPGYNMLAYPYPVQQALRSMALTNCAANGDVVYKWVPETATWASSIFASSTSNKWTANHVFNVGEGFWYKRGASAGTTNWTEVKPY